LVSLKFGNVVTEPNHPPLFGTSKTVPKPKVPPVFVVPRRLPDESMTNPPYGKDPLLILKFARVFTVPYEPPLIGSSYTVPYWPEPPLTVVPYRFPADSMAKPAKGLHRWPH
jgi:hypothetical protein